MGKKKGKEKSLEEKFAAALRTFVEHLQDMGDSPRKAELLGLLPYLQPSGVRNNISGPVAGPVVQVGSRLGGVWEEAAKLVASLSHDDLSLKFVNAATAAAACSSVRNNISGPTAGPVVQAGDVQGGIHIRR